MTNASRNLARPIVRSMLLAAAGLCAAALSLTAALPAAAHDQVVSSSPQPDSTVTDALSEVSVTFSEAPLDVAGARIGLEVLDPNGAFVGQGDARVDGATLTRRIATTVQGVYTVQYQTVASDGHNTSGSYTFTFAGPVAVVEQPSTGTTAPIPGGPLTAQPSTTATAPASAVAVAPTASVEPGDGAAPESSSAQTGLVVGAIVGALVVAGAIVTIIITVLRRRGGTPA